MKQFSLPTGWNVRLFEQCISKVKYTDKQPTKSFLEEGLFPVISQEKEFINGYSNNKDAVFTVKKPVVIFGDHTKNVKYVDFDFVIGADGVKILQPIQEIDSKYFYYYLCNIRLRDLGYARHYKLLKECVVCYPSLPEQKRIVEKLDKIFADIDKAKENTQKNLENAKEIFESFLNNIFISNLTGWTKKRIDEICENLDSKRIPITKNKRISGEIPYYGASGIVDYVKDYIFDEELLLVSEDGGNLIMRTYPIAFHITGKTWVNNHAHVLKFDNVSLEKLTKYFLNWISLEQYISGAAQPKLNQAALNSIEIPFPQNLSEQKKVVEQLDALHAKTQELEQIYTKKLADLDELKQSVLQQAFSGKL